MRKPAFCICENKDADQLRGNREADQRLCFRYKDSTIPLLPKSEISSLYLSSVAVQPGFCRTWSETPKTGFLTTRLICKEHVYHNNKMHTLHAPLVSSWMQIWPSLMLFPQCSLAHTALVRMLPYAFWSSIGRFPPPEI